MPRYAYDRLSAQDTSFLIFETPNAFTHGAGTAIYDAGPLATEDGGVDITSIKRAIEALLHQLPRFRQKLEWIPVERHPVWVDDPAFDIDYHVRHTRLPEPGTLDELKRVSARLLSNRMDFSRPLWEMWVIEGLEGGRFGLIQKVHHCMIDGASGVDLTQLLMSPDPEHKLPEPVPYIPRPAPTRWELFSDAVMRRMRMPFDAVRHARATYEDAREMIEELRMRAKAVAGMVGSMRGAASPSPLNAQIGPHRRVDWLGMSLDEVKAVRKALGGTVNDVVLATVAGAVGRFMELRSVDPSSLAFRAAAPVSTRSESERNTMGNRVSMWLIDLPIGERDPIARLQAVRDKTADLKETNQAVGADVLFQVAEWTGTTLLSLAAQLATSSIPYSLMVTNIPGPQIPLYLCGAELLETYGYVPLVDDTALGIALFSYNGRLCWGFNADYELVPDLSQFVEATRESFRELQRAAGLY